MYCRYCHNLISDEAEFCSHCGKKVENGEAPEESNVRPITKISLEKKNPDENKTVPEEKTETKIQNVLPAENTVQHEPEKTSDETSDNNIIEETPVIADYFQKTESESEYPEYEPLPDEPVNPEPTENVKLGAGRIAGAVAVGVFACVFMLVLSFSFCIKLGISGDIMQKRIERMNTSNVLDAEIDGKSVSDRIYEETGFGKVNDGMADNYAFRHYMSRTDFIELSENKFSQYVDYILGKIKDDPSVTDEEIIEFFKNNGGASLDTFKYSLKSSDYSIILKSIIKNDTSARLSISHLDELAGFRLRNLSYAFSYITIAIFFALVLVLLIWIAVIADKHIKLLVSIYGNIFRISGIIVFFAGAAIILGSSIAYTVTGRFIFYATASLLLPFSLFALCTGAFEFTAGLIMGRIKKLINKKEKKESEKIESEKTAAETPAV